MIWPIKNRAASFAVDDCSLSTQSYTKNSKYNCSIFALTFKRLKIVFLKYFYSRAAIVSDFQYIYILCACFCCSAAVSFFFEGFPKFDWSFKVSDYISQQIFPHLKQSDAFVIPFGLKRAEFC